MAAMAMKTYVPYDTSPKYDPTSSSDDDEVPPGSAPPGISLKRPRAVVEEDLICSEDIPDLDNYFAGWPTMAPKDIATCCRAYATYQAARERAVEKKGKKK